MNTDRNKTELTKQVTQAAIQYLDERGCKPIETEVAVADGWVADVASVICPTQTELVLLKLIERKPGWDKPGVEEWYERARKMQRLMTVLVEVKTARSDFSRDWKWARAQPTNLAYLAVPNNLAIAKQELPSGWGILNFYEMTSTMRLVCAPKIAQRTEEQQLGVIYQIAITRDHSTRHQRIREFQKEIRAIRNDEISRTRVIHVIKAMKSIVEGKHGSVAEALQWHGIKHCPDYLMQELLGLWALKAASVVEER